MDGIHLVSPITNWITILIWITVVSRYGHLLKMLWRPSWAGQGCELAKSVILVLLTYRGLISVAGIVGVDNESYRRILEAIRTGINLMMIPLLVPMVVALESDNKGQFELSVIIYKKLNIVLFGAAMLAIALYVFS